MLVQCSTSWAIRSTWRWSWNELINDSFWRWTIAEITLKKLQWSLQPCALLNSSNRQLSHNIVQWSFLQTVFFMLLKKWKFSTKICTLDTTETKKGCLLYHLIPNMVCFLFFFREFFVEDWQSAWKKEIEQSMTVYCYIILRTQTIIIIWIFKSWRDFFIFISLQCWK